MFGAVDPRQQAPDLKHKGLIRAHLGFKGQFPEAFVGSPPHALRLRGKGCGHAGIAPKALPDLVGAAQSTVPYSLALAGMREAITMPAEEIAPRPIQLGDAPPAGDPIHQAGTAEIWSRSAETAVDSDYADGLGHVLPIAAPDAHAIGEMQLGG